MYRLNKARPVGQAVKTLASHAENMGSIPVRVTNENKGTPKGVPFVFVATPSGSNPLKTPCVLNMGSHTKRSHRRACSPVASAGIFIFDEIPVPSLHHKRGAFSFSRV